MDAVKLFQKHSVDELLAMRQVIQEKPENQTPKGSFYLYTPKARRKLDTIAWAITYHIKKAKGLG